MTSPTYRVYPYRWLLLGVYMAVNLTIQVLWISYAPITAAAGAYYGVGELRIGFLSMIFMLAFIPFSIPISWLIDRYGFYPSVAAGSLIVALCGIGRGLAGPSYGWVFAATLGMAAAQPFFLNSWTKVSATWFAPGERATAVGLVTLANLVGAILGQVLTPLLTAGASIARVQLWYGLAALVAGVAFIALGRERPPTPPDASAESERALMLAGLKRALGMAPFRRYLFITFVGLGIFNGINTWIEGLVAPRGLGSEAAAILVAIMMVAGLVGAIVLPSLSDRKGRRRPYIILGLVGAIPGLLGLALAQGFVPLAVSSAILGFFLVSVNPTGTQYASEIALPTPEGTSNGLISLAGQVSVGLVYLMEFLKGLTGSFLAPLLLLAALLLVSALLSLTLREKADLPAGGLT